MPEIPANKQDARDQELNHKSNQQNQDRNQEAAPNPLEQTVQESNAILHSFYDTAPLMMGVVEALDDDILHLSDNAAATRFMGVPLQGTERRLASELGMPREFIAIWLRHYRECARTQTSVQFEYAHHAVHKIYWFSVVVSYIATTQEGRLRCSYILQDITEQKNAAELLRQQAEALSASESRLRTLVDHFPEGAVVLFDKALRFTVAGGQGLSEAGMPSHFLEGKTVWEAFDPTVAAVNDPLMRAALDGNASTAEVAYGEAIYELNVLPIRNDVGEVVAGMTLTQDITARKQIEAEKERLLKQVEAERTRLRTVLEQMPAGVLMAEAPTGALFFANQEAARIYGLPASLPRSVFLAWQEWTSWKTYRTDGSLMNPDDYPLARALATGETTQDAVVIVERQEGSRATLLVNAAAIRNEQGEIVAGVEAFYDITERMEHLEEIEALNVRLRRSVQETHHRVKNNLQIISALVELQVEANEPTVPVAAMIRIGQHTRSLAAIHDLLTQETKLDAHTDSISTKAALDKLVPLLQATTGGRIICDRVEDFRLPVREGASLALLVSELISNAVKHGRGTIELTLTVNKSVACLEVCDDGPGFPPDFDWRKAANTGLGLIDSTGRYDLRGSISYENRVEGGARVVVIFPVPDH